MLAEPATTLRAQCKKGGSQGSILASERLRAYKQPLKDNKYEDLYKQFKLPSLSWEALQDALALKSACKAAQTRHFIGEVQQERKKSQMLRSIELDMDDLGK